MPKTQLLLLLLCVGFALSSDSYHKIVHMTDPDAKCLDGTPPVLYLHEGGDEKRFLLYFIGGGICSGLTIDSAIEDCYKRSKTILGSSDPWPEKLDGEGYLSPDPAKNKFASWTKIVFGYCDGSLHQGNRENPIPYKDTELYFKGAAITRSHFKWIQNHYDLKGADKVVMTGTSAGGVATYIWTNYMMSLVSEPRNVLSIPDSSVLVNFTTYSDGVDYLNRLIVNNFKLANIEEKTPLDLCNRRYPNEQYKCLFFEYAWTSFQARTLVINSQYDSWAINNTLGIRCLKEGVSGETLDSCDAKQRDYIEKYHERFRDVMQFYTMNSRHSAWTIGCVNHGYTYTDEFYNSPLQKIPTKTGITIQEAVEAFVFEEKRVMAEESGDWPENSACAH